VIAAATEANLGNFMRTLATPEPIKEWSLTSLMEKLDDSINELIPNP
jgi:hypothetical protein